MVVTIKLTIAPGQIVLADALIPIEGVTVGFTAVVTDTAEVAAQPAALLYKIETDFEPGVNHFRVIVLSVFDPPEVIVYSAGAPETFH
jgi:hypothetical protein